MKKFSILLSALDEDRGTRHKVDVLSLYFQSTPSKDAIWAIYLLTGRTLKRLTLRRHLIELIQKKSLIEPWLFEECYAVVGDFAETFALLWSNSHSSSLASSTHASDSGDLHEWMEIRLPSLRSKDQKSITEKIELWFQHLSRHETFLALKLLTGGFRSGVAQGLVIKALSQAFDQPTTTITEHFSGDWPVHASWFEKLLTGKDLGTQNLSPLPFYLASPLSDIPDSLGDIQEFCIEWKWDGIRAQMIKTGEGIAIWSRGEELITDRFPELAEAIRKIPTDFILDGEILAGDPSNILPFSELQKRLGRKVVTNKLREKIPVSFIAFDCLRIENEDIRSKPLIERRSCLETRLSLTHPISISPLIVCPSWRDAEIFREDARKRQVEGLMLKRWDSTYLSGRKRGEFWKWKLDPMTLDAVLIYAQAGHGRRASLYTDYTFALWQNHQLVPFAKTYSGLTDAEIQILDQWIRKHTLERFGPVRSVEPLKVFEIAFEGISRSNRHKSGIAVRFPRILRERLDKKADEADSVDKAISLIEKT